ncbi:MAG: 50S ribosomal protein L6 [Phycisphaerales bacterium]
MSRIGKKPVSVPGNVKVAIKDRTVSVQGPGGTLSLTHPERVGVKWAESEKQIVVSIAEGDMEVRQVRADWGSTRAHLQNMIKGVTAGYEKKLEVVGVGWVPSLAGNKLKLVVGYANPLMMEIPKGLTVTVDKQFVTVKGADKQAVGMFASNMRSLRKPEPYNGKGIKYVEEVIKRKQGKTFGA